MTIPCENMFCIYFEDNRCIHDTVSIDGLGSCASVCYVDIPEDYLSFQRKKLLSKFEQLGNMAD